MGAAGCLVTFLAALCAVALAAGPNTTATDHVWKDVQQEGEFNWWAERLPSIIAGDSKAEWRRTYRSYFRANGGFNINTRFVGKHVVDVGSGPRPLAASFTGAKVACIEPLGSRFLQWMDERRKAGNVSKDDYLELEQCYRVFSTPAETPVPELLGTADVVLSTNSLDHALNPTAYLESCATYLRDNTSFVLLTVDLHTRTDELHQMKFTLTRLMNAVEAAGLELTRASCTGKPAHPGISDASCWVVLRKCPYGEASCNQSREEAKRLQPHF